MPQQVTVNFPNQSVTTRIKREATQISINIESKIIVVQYKEQSFVVDGQDVETPIGDPVRKQYHSDFAALADGPLGIAIAASTATRLALPDPASANPAPVAQEP